MASLVESSRQKIIEAAEQALNNDLSDNVLKSLALSLFTQLRIPSENNVTIANLNNRIIEKIGDTKLKNLLLSTNQEVLNTLMRA